MARALEVAIVGYGIAGIAAAIRLRRLGHRITHFDRHDPPLAPGAGMLLHPPALRELDRLGLLEAAMALGTPVRRICATTVGGRPLMDFGYADLGAKHFGLGIQRQALHHLLSNADTGRDGVRGGCKITALDADQGCLFEDPGIRHGPYDLIVVADGSNSRLRGTLPLGPRRDRRSDSAALVGLLDDPDRVVPDRLVQHFDKARHLSVWPAGRGSSGEPPRCSIAMSVSLGEAAAFRDLGHWRSAAMRLWPGIENLLAGRVADPGLHVFSYGDVELSRYAFGRAVVIGDAAHSMSPQLGVGAQLAMEDAAVLAAEIGRHGDLPAALHSYSRQRSLQLRRYHRASRWLTPLFQSESRMLAMLREHAFGKVARLAPARHLMHALLC